MDRTLPSIRCAWCYRVDQGTRWANERREYYVKYRMGICQACEAKLFPNGLRAGAAPRQNQREPVAPGRVL